MSAMGLRCHQKLTEVWMSTWSELGFDGVHAVNNCCAKKWLGGVCCSEAKRTTLRQ